jgi:hypothetical protein
MNHSSRPSFRYLFSVFTNAIILDTVAIVSTESINAVSKSNNIILP